MTKPLRLDDEAAEELDAAAIVYVELDDEIRVLAIAHGSRQPGFWRYRL